MVMWLVLCWDGEFKAFNNKAAAESCAKDRKGQVFGPIPVQERHRSCFRKAA